MELKQIILLSLLLLVMSCGNSVKPVRNFYKEKFAEEAQKLVQSKDTDFTLLDNPIWVYQDSIIWKDKNYILSDLREVLISVKKNYPDSRKLSIKVKAQKGTPLPRVIEVITILVDNGMDYVLE